MGEGSYGIVCECKSRCIDCKFLPNLSFLIYALDRARDTRNGEIVALKRVRMDQEKDGLPVSGLREIMILKRCQHENIVRLREVVVGKSLDRLV